MEFKHDSWDFVARFGKLSRDMLAAMLDQSSDCVKILDPEGRIEFINRLGRSSMEIDEFATVAARRWDELWPEESREAVRAAIDAAQAGRPARFEAFCPTAKGRPKWWDVSVTPVRDDERGLFAILAVSRDVTDRHRAMESLTAMAHEMRHRLRNAYAVSGAIALASGREDEPHREFAAQLAQRLNSLSAVQSSLIEPTGGASLATVVGQMVEAFDATGTIRIEPMPEIELDEQTVRLLGLVLGELITNSMKHGALSAGEPASLGASHDAGRLTLVWREAALAGEPRSAWAAGEGSGHRLLRRLARAHGGAFTFALGAGGVEARLETIAAR